MVLDEENYILILYLLKSILYLPALYNINKNLFFREICYFVSLLTILLYHKLLNFILLTLIFITKFI
jgi:hypothetical protein